MNLDAIALVQDSLNQAMQEPERARALFYGRLFSLYPALRAIFSPVQDRAGPDFLVTITAGLQGLAAPQTVIPMLKQAGRVYAARGLRYQDYQRLGEALLWTVAEVLGEELTAAGVAACADAFHLLAGLMKEAAAGAEE